MNRDVQGEKKMMMRRRTGHSVEGVQGEGERKTFADQSVNQCPVSPQDSISGNCQRASY
jgi:hypothetical protein